VSLAGISSAKSCTVLQKTQRASSEVTDFTTTASATGELKILVRFNSVLGHHYFNCLRTSPARQQSPRVNFA
jgi:hypothetical protein